MSLPVTISRRARCGAVVRALLRLALDGRGARLILQNPDDVALFAQARLVNPALVRLIPVQGSTVTLLPASAGGDEAPLRVCWRRLGTKAWPSNRRQHAGCASKPRYRVSAGRRPRSGQPCGGAGRYLTGDGWPKAAALAGPWDGCTRVCFGGCGGAAELPRRPPKG